MSVVTKKIEGKRKRLSRQSFIDRKKKVDDALAISTLDAKEPTIETKKLAVEYISGNIEIPEMLEEVIARYKK